MPHPHPDLGQEAWLRFRPLPETYAASVAPFLGNILSDTTLPAPGNMLREYAQSRHVFLGKHARTDARPLKLLHDPALAPEHYRLDLDTSRGFSIAAADPSAALYGLFYLLRALQLHIPPSMWPGTDGPRITLRALNHWDNVYPKVDIERGYGGETLFRWDLIPDDAACMARLAAYARLLASVGINGLFVNNVNVGDSGSQLLRPDWFPRLATVAEIFRGWGIRLGLSISYAAPVLLGELDSADPRDPAVQAWWRARADTLYEAVPDCLGWLVKADSEGQPGPLGYGLDHAEGSRHLAEALAPHDGRLFWRAFVYGHDKGDIMAQPYRHFKPLDGHFAHGVTLQVKNGPRDFQVREPIHPLIGAMEHTPTAVELQITQEYLGHDTHICFLPALWEEFLRQPAQNHPSAAEFLISHPEGALIGIANTHDAPNWTGLLFAQANLYGFARLAWNPQTPASTLAQDWATLSFDRHPAVVQEVTDILLQSWPTFEGYTAPFSLGQVYNQSDTWDSDHFDPAPWRNNGKDWFLANEHGIGIDRSPESASAFLGQYPPVLQARYADPRTCPSDNLLFFHHLPWDWPLPDGDSLIQSIYSRYHDSAARLDEWITRWTALAAHTDAHRHAHVLERLRHQRLHARLWARYMTSYLLSISNIPDRSGRTYR
jgi:alpha-glucuronidase